MLALRQWILPGGDGSAGPDVEAIREAARSVLGALAFALPGGLVFEGTYPDIELPEEAVAELTELRRQCDPAPADALKSALDGAVVAVVAAGTWWWHLGRARRDEPARADVA